VFVLLLAITAFELIPSLQPSNDDSSIDMYNSKLHLKGTLSLTSGGFAIIPFEYRSYDPAIIVLELSVLNCENPGNFTLYCNYRSIASVWANSETPPVTLNLISVSGSDWIEPVSAMFGLNELLFESNDQNGYSGNLSYQITIRGSR
jgi:hypothetical protein